MSNDTRKAKKEKKLHTANYIISRFLNSKRSLKKVYRLDIIDIALLRYIYDSIDLNYSKQKVFHTKIYQSQIARFCHCSLNTVKRRLKTLRQRRLIKYDSKRCLITIGQVLTAWLSQSYPKEVALTELSTRSSSPGPIANSSNFTNNGSFENESKEPGNAEAREELTDEQKLINANAREKALADIRELTSKIRTKP